MTEFAMSKHECLTKHSNITTPDLNFVCISGDIKMSSLSWCLILAHGEAGVLYFGDCIKEPNSSFK
jgi:hypothetical protein